METQTLDVDSNRITLRLVFHRCFLVLHYKAFTDLRSIVAHSCLKLQMEENKQQLRFCQKYTQNSETVYYQYSVQYKKNNVNKRGLKYFFSFTQKRRKIHGSSEQSKIRMLLTGTFVGNMAVTYGLLNLSIGNCFQYWSFIVYSIILLSREMYEWHTQVTYYFRI